MTDSQTFIIMRTLEKVRRSSSLAKTLFVDCCTKTSGMQQPFDVSHSQQNVSRREVFVTCEMSCHFDAGFRHLSRVESPSLPKGLTRADATYDALGGSRYCALCCEIIDISGRLRKTNLLCGPSGSKLFSVVSDPQADLDT